MGTEMTTLTINQKAEAYDSLVLLLNRIGLDIAGLVRLLRRVSR